MPHVYQSAHRHLENAAAEDLPELAAYTHGGFLLIWLLHNGMVRPHISERFHTAIQQLNDNQLTCGQFFHACGGEIDSDMLTTAGNNFALAYIDRFYFEDYQNLFKEDFPRTLDVTDNDEHLEIVCDMLDTILLDHQD